VLQFINAENQSDYSIDEQIMSPKEQRIFIVIPAYLEEPAIRDVLTNLQRAGYSNIVVVDDGSSDRTYQEVLKVPHVFAARHLVNRGKGAAVRTGLDIAKQQGADIVVTFDADGQHVAADIGKLVKAIGEGYDVALGRRTFKTEDMPAMKIFFNHIASVITMILFGIKVSDTQCGLRAYSSAALEQIETRADRYAFDTEVIKEIKRHRLKYKEVPIDVIYNEHSQTKAERSTLTHAVKTLIKFITSA